MPRGGYFTRTGQAVSARDLRVAQQESQENQAIRVSIDLTVARSNVPLGLSGTSLYIADIGGADWQIRLSSPTADALYSTDFRTGTVLEFEFTELYFTNAAAASGTAPVIFIVGRRV